jgi:hypothetical protein
METETILWSKHVIILVILNFKLTFSNFAASAPSAGFQLNPLKLKIFIVVVGPGACSTNFFQNVIFSS